VGRSVRLNWRFTVGRHCCYYKNNNEEVYSQQKAYSIYRFTVLSPKIILFKGEKNFSPLFTITTTDVYPATTRGLYKALRIPTDFEKALRH